MNFLRDESEVFEVFKNLCQNIQEEKISVIVKVRSEHGKEFENAKFSEFCDSEGISHEFSCSITSLQDEIVEQKTRAIQESTRVMLHAKKNPFHFWAEAMNTACYIHNRVTQRKGTSATLYEIWRGRKPTVKYFHVFGSNVTS